MKRQSLELVASTPLSDSVRSLTFRCLQAPLSFRAGQWVNLYVPAAGALLKRSYSIANGPEEGGNELVEVAVTRVAEGPVSTYLHEMQPGARVEFDGPHGFFTRDESGPAVFVGVGSGLAPLRSMLEEDLRHVEGPELVLLFGCRTWRDVLWREQLQCWDRSHPRLRLEITLSRSHPEWQGRRGYVQDHLEDVIDPANKVPVYVCGLTKMIKAVRRVLKQDLGYERRMIHTERYD